MRVKMLIAIAIGAILISSSVFGHHKRGHQSPNTPVWGIPESVDCNRIEDQIEKMSNLLELISTDSSLRLEAEEYLNLLLASFAARCQNV